MSDKGKQDDQRVRFGSNQIPMPEAKRKLALADEAQDKLVQLTERYPDLKCFKLKSSSQGSLEFRLPDQTLCLLCFHSQPLLKTHSQFHGMRHP
jgi:hypothetical protein